MRLHLLKNNRDKDIYINSDHITCIVTSPEREEECLIYFNGESDNCIRVSGTLSEIAKELIYGALEWKPTQ